MGVESDRAYSFDRELLELRAEAQGCDDPQERSVIRGELTQVAYGLAKLERGQEQRMLLPAVWQTVYGTEAGYLALFSGVRADRKLTRPFEGFFRWPEGLTTAQQWVERQV